jgi:hypothetical protein
MMWWNHEGWGAGDWLAMGLTMVLLWALLIALVVWLVHSSRDRSLPPIGRQGQSGGVDQVLIERPLAARWTRPSSPDSARSHRRAALEGRR